MSAGDSETSVQVAVRYVYIYDVFTDVYVHDVLRTPCVVLYSLVLSMVGSIN